MITLVLGAITLLFVAYAALKGSIENALKIKICALCAAVSTTWIAMLILKIAGMAVDKTLLGLLLGESIAGMIYSSTGKAKVNPLVGLPAILFGTTIAYSLIEWRFDSNSLFILIPVALIMAIISASIGKRGKHDGLLKKLENCCG